MLAFSARRESTILWNAFLNTGYLLFYKVILVFIGSGPVIISILL